MKKFVFLAFIIVVTTCVHAQEINTKEMNRFINKLMKRMTLEEKIGQTNLTLPSSPDLITGESTNKDVNEKIRRGHVGSIIGIWGVEKIRKVQEIAVEESRLHIPLLIGLDVVHGYKTIFPIPLAQSCSWDMAAIQESACIAAAEASADGISWTYSPMVDISQDARWGRVAEGAGEDPFLGGEIAKAMIKGYQGDDLYSNNKRILACVKHYALYGAAIAGLDYMPADMSRHRMFNEYMYPYKAAVEGGALSFMAAFNEVEGIPATASKYLMTDILRNQWKFPGFVVTDYTAISEMQNHGIGDVKECARRALLAGIDVDMISEAYYNHLPELLKEGAIDRKMIDKACRRVLEIKYRMGLFDNPYKYCDVSRPAKEEFLPEYRKKAQKLATESFVLLKNDKDLLPLERKGKIAIVGPLANNRANMVGCWSGAVDLNSPMTVVEAVSKAVEGKAEVMYAKGSNLCYDAELEKRVSVLRKDTQRDSRSAPLLLDEAMNIAKEADVIIAAVGEAAEMSGESTSRSDITIPDAQRDLLKKLSSLGKPIVLLLFNGRPLTLDWESENIPAILDVWFGGTEAAPAIAQVLFGDVNPSGKLTMTFPKAVGQCPIFYNHKNSGRPLANAPWFSKFRVNYLDVNGPQYPFGYGLSYTEFKYGNIVVDGNEMTPNGKIKASIKISNTGNYDGTEVVQLYIRDLIGSVTRPLKELKGFKRIELKKSESKVVEFDITADLLKFYNSNLEYVCEPGDFELMIGPNSRDTQSVRFTLK